MTPNDEYKNFVIIYLETAAECIPTKSRAEFHVENEIRKKHSYLIKETL